MFYHLLVVTCVLFLNLMEFIEVMPACILKSLLCPYVPDQDKGSTPKLFESKAKLSAQDEGESQKGQKKTCLVTNSYC